MIAYIEWRDLGQYCSGFRQGAEDLRAVLRQRGHDQDILVYPLVYCLRHCVELILKQVILASRDLLDEPTVDFPDGHKLGNLWNTCKPLLKQIWSSDPSYQQVANTIDALESIDPVGEGFRYPVTTKKRGTRAASLDHRLQKLDLEALYSDVMETIDLLEGADFGIDAHMEWKAEMRAEYDAHEAEMRAEHDATMRYYNEP